MVVSTRRRRFRTITINRSNYVPYLSNKNKNRKTVRSNQCRIWPTSSGVVLQKTLHCVQAPLSVHCSRFELRALSCQKKVLQSAAQSSFDLQRARTCADNKLKLP